MFTTLLALSGFAFAQAADPIPPALELGSPNHAAGLSIGLPVGLSYQYWDRSGFALDLGFGVHFLSVNGHARAGYYVDSSQAPLFIRATFVGGIRVTEAFSLFDDSYLVGPSAAVHLDLISTGPRREVGGAVGLVIGGMYPFSQYDHDEFSWASVPEFAITGKIVF